MNAHATVGHNNPPDPIDEICAAYEAARMEAENWLDGSAVENEAQMNAVDAIRSDAREWRVSLEKGQKSATAPLYDAYKAEGARWKTVIDDAKRIEKGLVALVGDFKVKLAAEKEAARKKAEAEAWEKTRAAREAAEKANAADIDAQRAAAQAEQEAKEAQRAASAASKDTTKGLRTYDVTEIKDGTALARWIWQNDRDAIMAWMDEYATRHRLHVPGVVETRKEKRAY